MDTPFCTKMHHEGSVSGGLTPDVASGDLTLNVASGDLTPNRCPDKKPVS